MTHIQEIAQDWAEAHRKFLLEKANSSFREISAGLPDFSSIPVHPLPRAIAEARLGEKNKVDNSFFYYDSSKETVVNALVLPAFARLAAAVNNQAPPGSLLRDTYGVGKTRFVTSLAKGMFARREDFIFVTIDRDNYQGIFQSRKLWSTLELITHRFRCTNQRGGPLHPKTFEILNEPMPGIASLRKGDMIDRLPRPDVERLEISLRVNDGLYVEPLAGPQSSDEDFQRSLELWRKPRTALAFPEPTALGYARVHPDVTMQAYINEWGNFRPDQQKEATSILSSLCSGSARSGSIFSTDIQGGYLQSLPLSGKAVLFVDYNPNDAQQIGGSGMIHSRLRGELLMPVPDQILGIYSGWMEGLGLWKDKDGTSAQQDTEKFLSKPDDYLPFHSSVLMDADRYLNLVTFSVKVAEQAGRQLVSPAFNGGLATDQIEKFFGPEAVDAAERALSHEQFFEMRQITDFLSDYRSLVSTFGSAAAPDVSQAIMSAAVARFSGPRAVSYFFKKDATVTPPYNDVKGKNQETFLDAITRSVESIRTNSAAILAAKGSGVRKVKQKTSRLAKPATPAAPAQAVSTLPLNSPERLARLWMTPGGGNLTRAEAQLLIDKATSIPNLAALLEKTPDAELLAAPAIKLNDVLVALIPTDVSDEKPVHSIGESNQVFGRILKDDEQALLNAYFVKVGTGLADVRNVATTASTFYVGSTDTDRSVQFRNLWYKLPNTPDTPQISQILDPSLPLKDMADKFAQDNIRYQLHRAKTKARTPTNRGPDHLLGAQL